MADLRFDESQSTAILRRAAELQSDAVPTSAIGNASLPELLRAAAEVGIDPKLVEQAADELLSHQLAPAATASGISALYERTVDRELSKEAWEDVLVALRTYTGRRGEGSYEDAGAEWHCRSDSVGVTFTASPRNGRTKLRLVGDTSNVTAVAWTLGATAAIVGGPMAFALSWKFLGSSFVAMLVGLVVVTAALVGTTFGIWRTRRRIRKELDRLMDALAQRAEQGD
jgi:hypothetical protein